MKPSVKRTVLEENHILQEKIGVRGRARGFVLCRMSRACSHASSRSAALTWEGKASLLTKHLQYDTNHPNAYSRTCSCL